MIVTLCPTGQARAQSELRPLSVTKLQVASPETVPEQRLEAGLLWGMGWYGSRFSGSGEAEEQDLLATRAELGLRFVFGVFDERDIGALEAGFLLPVAFTWSESSDPAVQATPSATGLGDVPVGLKYRFITERLASLAIATSVTVPTGDRAAGLGRGYTQWAGGVLFASQPLDWLGIDASFSAGGTLGVDDADKPATPVWGISHEVGFAWLLEGLMPCLELVYRVNENGGDKKQTSHLFALNLGVNVQLNDRVILMQGAQIDLAGRHARKGAMWFMSVLFLT
jgi:hypothetical protein